MTPAIYIGGYAQPEADKLAQMGLTIIYLDVDGDVRPQVASQIAGSRVLLRGPKLKPVDYSHLFAKISKAGIDATTTPDQYEILSNSSRYEEIIPSLVPPMRSFELSDKERIRDELTQLKEWDQIFVRSELGSAAKIAGIDACIIREFTLDELELKLSALAAAFPKAERVVARKVEAVKQFEGRNAEGRFIVLSGRVKYMDHCELSSSEQMGAFRERNEVNAMQVADLLASAGVAGDYFLDIAEKDSGGWFVVEIKPILNGTIRNVEQLAEALR